MSIGVRRSAELAYLTENGLAVRPVEIAAVRGGASERRSGCRSLRERMQAAKHHQNERQRRGKLSETAGPTVGRSILTHRTSRRRGAPSTNRPLHGAGNLQCM